MFFQALDAELQIWKVVPAGDDDAEHYVYPYLIIIAQFVRHNECCNKPLAVLQR